MVAARFIALALALLASAARAATPYPCDGPNGLPVPKICEATEKLASTYTGPALTVEKQTSATETAINFRGDHLDIASLNAFMVGQSFLRVTRLYNQVFGASNAEAAPRITTTGNTTVSTQTISNVPAVASVQIGMTVIGAAWPNGALVTAADVGAGTVTVNTFSNATATGTPLIFTAADTPRIAALKIGAAPALLFEGSPHNGRAVGLDLSSSLQIAGISPQTYTIFMVVRPTSSMYRNQAFTPGVGEGTLLSLENGAPFSISGDTTVGNARICNVSPFAGLSNGMTISSPSDGPFPNGAIIVSLNAADGACSGSTPSATMFSVAAATRTGAALLTTRPVIRLFANGDAGPGEIAVSDHSTLSLTPQDTMIETGPVVIAVTSDATGVKQYQNEIVRSTSSRSALANFVTQGYLGRMGLTRTGPFSKSGDFWLSAFLVYDVALTQHQTAAVRAMLYERFSGAGGLAVNQQRSRPSAKSVIFAGDSIPAGYNAEGLYGMVSRLADLFPAVRFGNYSMPASQVTSSVGMPSYGYLQGMFPASIAPGMNYSKVKNLLVVIGGGNDLTDVTPAAPVTITIASPGVIGWTAHGLAVGQRLYFQSNGDTLPTPLAFGPNVGPTYWVKTVVDPDHFTISATPSGAAIDTSGSQSGTHMAVAYTKTANSVYAGIVDVVGQALAAGATKVFVSKILPRVGTPYFFVLDDLNTCIVNGAGGSATCGVGAHSAYTVIDPYTNACLAANPDPPGSFTPGACYPDGLHPGDLGHATMATQILQPALAGDLN